MRVLITGAGGFIGKNLVARLAEHGWIKVSIYNRRKGLSHLPALLENADIVIHLAGVNRASKLDEFSEGNTVFTAQLCEAISNLGKQMPIIYSSSIQVEHEGIYSSSKLCAEEALKRLSKQSGCPVHIYRLPNIFGKWAKPNYNSVVATFCYNIARDIQIKINDPKSPINLVYIDDLIDSFLELIGRKGAEGVSFEQVRPIYQLTVGKLADLIQGFKESRENLLVNSVGVGLVRAMYATYLSYLPKESFVYQLKKNSDARGVFVEMLKTEQSGQFSYFTILPGFTRGGHYHHTKTEKFFVVRGKAVFRFCHVATGETFESSVSDEDPQVVETIPGWAHDVTNVGKSELFCMIWANEIYDLQRPDTNIFPLQPGKIEPAS